MQKPFHAQAKCAGLSLANFLFPGTRPFHAGGVISLSAEEILGSVKAALAEDIGQGDVTSMATIPPGAEARAEMSSREPLKVAGLGFAECAFRALCGTADIQLLGRDGDSVPSGVTLLTVTAPTRALLGAERVALNFVQRLSGVATSTARFVEAVRGTKAQILDTRKTTPGWRRFEKYAVECGGGQNHRMGLFDMVLIKDNHLRALQGESPNPVAAAVRRARTQFPQLKVEVEADTLEQVRQAVEAGADFILLDNMTLDQLRQAVRQVGGRSKTEASGGVALASVRAIAETGVDFISVGAITHSARSVDIGLDLLAASGDRQGQSQGGE